MRWRHCEESQFWISVAAPKVRLFCHPFEQLSGQSWHEAYSDGRWNVEQMFQDHADALVHSSVHRREDQEVWSGGDLFFKLSDEVFVFGTLDCLEDGLISIWATTLDLARSEHRKWRSKYVRPPKRQKRRASFHVLSIIEDCVTTKPVPIVRRFPTGDSDLQLHYGDDFPGWVADFIRQLKAHVSGVSILQGEPGTGKTSFLRHLIRKLRRTHRFYYLPVNQWQLLSAPQLVQFWLGESHHFEKMVKVIMIEDAEPLLITRGRDNQDQLSNLLNISDGLLGEFLKLHLICTINCEIEKLDPAVIRAGRLVAYRNFGRLNRAEAARLALAKRLRIPAQETYSLAEIYNEQRSGFEETKIKRVGFG